MPVNDVGPVAQASGIRYIGFRHESDARHAAAAAGFLTKKPERIGTMLAAVAAVVSGVTIMRFGLLDHEVSLIHGWLPWTVQVIAAVALAAAVGWRSRWWQLVCVPCAGLVGVVAAGVVGWYINSARYG